MASRELRRGRNDVPFRTQLRYPSFEALRVNERGGIRDAAIFLRMGEGKWSEGVVVGCELALCRVGVFAELIRHLPKLLIASTNASAFVPLASVDSVETLVLIAGLRPRRGVRVSVKVEPSYGLVSRSRDPTPVSERRMVKHFGTLGEIRTTTTMG
jgi:hypothetical protein